MNTVPLAREPGKQESACNSLLNAALDYAGKGWRIFPVHTPTGRGCSCHKPNCDAIGKHSRVKAWPDVATTDATTIRNWWAKWPDANVGIATGLKSRLLVLDVDNKNGKDGNAALAALCRLHNWKPETFTVKTASGRHLYFAHPGGTITGGTCVLGPGLDVQGDGKCVITAPSLHQAGCHYECLDSNAPIAELPDPILALVSFSRKSGDTRIQGRNMDLTSIAGRERRAGATESEIRDRLLTESQSRYKMPLGCDEVLRIARSVARYDPATPNLYWMPLYMNDWFGSLVVRTGKACHRGMYASLIFESWQRQGILPNDPALLWRLAQADSLEQFEQEQALVLSEFREAELDDKPILMHPRIAQLWVEQAKKYEQKVEAGRKSGASRRSHKRKTLAVKTT